MRTLADVKTFLLDMDGTFYLGENLIEGSLEFIEQVKATGRDSVLRGLSDLNAMQKNEEKNEGEEK